MTREEVIQAAQDAAAATNGPISRSDFERISGISQYHIYRLFPEGGWSEVKELAGLAPHPKDNQPIEDLDLLVEFHRVATELGRIPTWAMFGEHATVSPDVVRRRFGGLQGTLRRYRDWLEERHPDSKLLPELQTRSRHEIPPPPPVSGKGITPEWPKTQGAAFGPPLDFRGLRHAPINEQGVVFLFGMVAYELGFIVEAVHSSYPDCEAKRSIDSSGSRWQRVRIEFEFQSRNFRDHGHDPDKCDVVVCWEHNWPECPLEVIELRTVLDNLEG